MIEYQTEHDLAIKFASILEKNSFEQARKKLVEIGENDLEKLVYFRYLLDGFLIFSYLCQHKIILADILAKESNVVTTPEDRTRIVFLLASNATKDLPSINQAFIKEFGNFFTLKEKYIISGKLFTWKEMATRAYEIKNGLMNHSYFMVLGIVKDILSFYHANMVPDSTTQMKEMKKKVEDILLLTNGGAEVSPLNPDMKKTNQLIESFYKETNHLQIEIDKILNEPTYDKVRELLFPMQMVLETKLYLVSKNIPFNDYKAVEKYLLNELGRTELMSRISVEELERKGIKLKPMTSLSRAAASSV